MRSLILLALFAAPMLIGAKEIIRLEDIKTQADMRSLEDTIKTAFECIGKIIKNGLPDLQIPSLDPLVIKNLSLNLTSLTGNLISGSAGVSDLYAQGASTFQIPYVDGTIGIIPPKFTTEFEVLVPNVTLKTNYELNVNALGKNFTGKGEISYEANDFKFGGTIVVKVIGLVFEKLQIRPSLGKNKLTITGLMDDPMFSEYVSALVTSQLPSLLEKYQSDITKLIEDYGLALFKSCKDTIPSGNPLELPCKVVNTILKSCLPF